MTQRLGAVRLAWVANALSGRLVGAFSPAFSRGVRPRETTFFLRTSFGTSSRPNSCGALHSLQQRTSNWSRSILLRAFMSTTQGVDAIVHAAHILVEDEATADMAMERVASGGESFADVARELSTCPSKSKGGDLGWFGRGQMAYEFDRVCFTAEPGTLAKVKTKFGYHIVAVVARAPLPGEMTAEDLSEILANESEREAFQMIDVREEAELKLASLPGFVNLPLSKYDEWAPVLTKRASEGGADGGGDDGKGSLISTAAATLDPAKPTVVLCHMGVRSMQMAHFLCTKGSFQSVFNVAGGIAAYANEVDASVGRY